MNPILKTDLITLPVLARRAVPLPFKIGLCAFGLTEIVGCNKRSALHHNVRRNARWLLRPTATVYKCIPKIGLITYILIAAPLTYAEELGRLFFTAEQRAQLEYSQRQSGDTPDNPRSLTVNGIVQKHGGERTVWINGVPQPAGRSDERAPESVPIAIPGQSQPAKVKVGQRVIIGPATTEK